MSGMTPDDARLILPLVKRVREETMGAKKWDDNGIWVELVRCKGQNLAVTLERFFRHAADPKADNPGSVRRPFLPDAPTAGPVFPPKRDEACLTCGRHIGGCICGEQRTRPVVVDPEVAHRGAALARELLSHPQHEATDTEEAS